MSAASRFAVIGLGRFGLRLARGLAAAGAEVTAVDSSPQAVDEVRDEVTLAVSLDATDEVALRAQGIDKVAAAVVAIGTAFEAAALTTSILKQIGVRRVISRASTRTRGEILLRIGADEIVNPEEETADRWRDRLVMPQIREKIDLGDSHALIQMRAPSSWAGKPLRELNIRKKYEVNVVAIRRLLATSEGESAGFVIDTPMPDSRIETGDTLLVVGRNEALGMLPKD